jgi:hypothetical protein
MDPSRQQITCTSSLALEGAYVDVSPVAKNSGASCVDLYEAFITVKVMPPNTTYNEIRRRNKLKQCSISNSIVSFS